MCWSIRTQPQAPFKMGSWECEKAHVCPLSPGETPVALPLPPSTLRVVVCESSCIHLSLVLIGRDTCYSVPPSPFFPWVKYVKASVQLQAWKVCLLQFYFPCVKNSPCFSLEISLIYDPFPSILILEPTLSLIVILMEGIPMAN